MVLRVLVQLRAPDLVQRLVLGEPEAHPRSQSEVEIVHAFQRVHQRVGGDLRTGAPQALDQDAGGTTWVTMTPSEYLGPSSFNSSARPVLPTPEIVA